MVAHVDYNRVGCHKLHKGGRQVAQWMHRSLVDSHENA